MDSARWVWAMPSRARRFLARDGSLTTGEDALLRELLRGATSALLCVTSTRVDVGEWFRKRRVWVCCTRDEVILFAYGRRAFAERVGMEGVREARYNGVTGQLVLAPADGVTCRQLDVAPVEGCRILAALKRKGDAYA